MSTIETALPLMQGLLGFIMLAAGSAKLFGIDLVVEDFDRYDYPEWFRFITGVIEVFGGLGLLVGLVFAPTLAVLGGLLTVATMAGAILTHLFRVDDPLWRFVGPSVYLTIGLFVTAFHLLSF
ncbi:DoxX family protein [Saliphagus infecundisoli]|uniref:DoxX family protein n=1 Tax=Saliphagus infecundisoli TaxID=1849069 RepID=A0ABD5QLB9_9EURY|nr:DoxX family protein [Saliphagus infecundisoli]